MDHETKPLGSRRQPSPRAGDPPTCSAPLSTAFLSRGRGFRRVAGPEASARKSPLLGAASQVRDLGRGLRQPVAYFGTVGCSPSSAVFESGVMTRPISRELPPRGRLTTGRRKLLALDLLGQGHTLAHVRKVLGINRVTVYRWRQDDPSFAEAYSDAMEAGTDLIEHEARRRAVEGYDRPIRTRVGRGFYSTSACMTAFSKSRSSSRLGLLVCTMRMPTIFSFGSTQKCVPKAPSQP
jgi:hypothetical protein